MRQQRSKTLSGWLRHKPERGGLTLSKEGWATIDAVLEAFEKQAIPTSRAELHDVVRLDTKGRFEVEGERIRARYGHSIELEEKPHPGKPPAILYHGTTNRYVDRILEAGLKPVKRTFVHLSPEKRTARDIGAKRDQRAVVVVIAAHEAYEAGVQFYPRGKGIWLSDPIPAQYISRLDETPNAESTEDKPKTARESAPGAPRRRRPKGGFTKRKDSRSSG